MRLPAPAIELPQSHDGLTDGETGNRYFPVENRGPFRTCLSECPLVSRVGEGGSVAGSWDGIALAGFERVEVTPIRLFGSSISLKKLPVHFPPIPRIGRIPEFLRAFFRSGVIFRSRSRIADFWPVLQGCRLGRWAGTLRRPV